jgi:hypothetical protein
VIGPVASVAAGRAVALAGWGAADRMVVPSERIAAARVVAASERVAAAPARRSRRPRGGWHARVGHGVVVALVGLAACGGSQPAPAAPSAPAGVVAAGAPTLIEQRRDVACDQLGPKLTACAVEDVRASLASGKISRAQFDGDTAPAVLRANTEKWVTECKAPRYSSRQVRVLEVCFRQEAQCAPLLECLSHLNPGAAAAP